MQALTVSTVTDSNSPARDDHQTTGETAVFLSKAAKHLDEWDVAARACAKEQEESEKEISAALDMLNEATKKTQESSVTFNADQQKQFCEQDKKMTKKLDAQSKQFDNKIDSLATSVQQQLTTNQSNTQQLLKEH
eukprot:1892637-Ditylum_brightwellii.AAC.1